VAAVLGAPGSGKTTLAIRTAHRLRAAHPDGALYAKLMEDGTPARTAEVLREFLITLGTPSDRVPDSVEDRMRAFRYLTVDRRLIIVLDDVTRREQLLPLLPSGAGCSVLAVMRRRIAPASVGMTVWLPPLSTTHGLELLTSILGFEPTGPDAIAWRELAELCGGLPMVLRSAATRLLLRPHWGAPFLVDRMRREPRLLVVGPHDELALTRSVAQSTGALSAAANSAFGSLSAMSQSSFSIEDAAQALRLDAAHTEALLEEIVEFQLADVRTEPPASEFRYAFPWLMRLAAASAPNGLALTRDTPGGDALLGDRLSG
jgi:hypothetical protein